MNWYFPAGSTADGPEIVRITPERAGWGYAGLLVLDLPAGQTYQGSTGQDEMVVLPLSGSCSVDSDFGGAQLAGRADVFCAVTDCVYVPRECAFSIATADGGRFALACARARWQQPFRHVPADQVRVELRGAGPCSRRVSNFATPDVLEADRLIACEVVTPAGNWSSYPPHKHDTERPGESVLEEIYYFEVAHGPGGPGLAYQRVYGTPERPADVLAEVRSGDVVIVPHGWHGPSMAAPGYDLYHLNVMAGPGRRELLVSYDPAHSWVREQWKTQQVDPRVSTWTRQ
jgi:5-deoxy-glucuronate isomerase